MQMVGKTMVKAPMKRPNRIQENDWGGGELNEFIKLSSEFGLGFAVSLSFYVVFEEGWGADRLAVGHVSGAQKTGIL